jgi:GNAT superfamily N-acetyltransferase
MSDDVIRLRKMSRADVPLGMRLKDQAGWNQTEADWQRLLELAPEGCFVAECRETPVGTAAACSFGSVGWISMVLVDPAFRGQGIGTRLVKAAIEHLERQQARSIRLDATPLGRPVYEKLGFRAEYELARWEGVAPVRDVGQFAVPAGSDELEAVAELDRRLTGTPRLRLIECLFRQQPGAMRVAAGPEGLAGYASWRDGSRARYIGPVMALSAETGRELADAMLAACAGRLVFVDVPCQNGPATRWATSCGFSVQRPFVRMVRGEAVADRVDCLWASSGPETG